MSSVKRKGHKEVYAKDIPKDWYNVVTSSLKPQKVSVLEQAM